MHADSDDAGTFVTAVPWPGRGWDARSPPPRTATRHEGAKTDGTWLILSDPRHEIVMLHSVERHSPLALIVTPGLLCTYSCPGCATTLRAIRPNLACPRCDTEVRRDVFDKADDGKQHAVRFRIENKERTGELAVLMHP